MSPRSHSRSPRTVTTVVAMATVPIRNAARSLERVPNSRKKGGGGRCKNARKRFYTVSARCSTPSRRTSRANRCLADGSTLFITCTSTSAGERAIDACSLSKTIQYRRAKVATWFPAGEDGQRSRFAFGWPKRRTGFVAAPLQRDNPLGSAYCRRCDEAAYALCPVSAQKSIFSCGVQPSHAEGALRMMLMILTPQRLLFGVPPRRGNTQVDRRTRMVGQHPRAKLPPTPADIRRCGRTEDVLHRVFVLTSIELAYAVAIQGNVGL
jgi:hypothetical protein